MRKTPFKHPVKSHLRSGRQVRHYIRGQGKKPTKLADPTTSFKKISHFFQIKIKYSNRSEENIKVSNVSSHPKAILEAMFRRQSSQIPTSVECIIR